MNAKKSLNLVFGLLVSFSSVWAADVEFRLPSDSSGAFTIDAASGDEALSVQADGTTKVATQTGGAVISGIDGSLVQPNSLGTGSLVLHANGGDNMVYGTGFAHNTETVVDLGETTDTLNGYDPATGLYTVSESGLYYVTYNHSQYNTKVSTDVFDGTAGQLGIYLKVNDEQIARVVAPIFRGVDIAGGPEEYQFMLNGLVHLNQGDVISPSFYTYATGGMGSSPETNLLVSRNRTHFKLYKY